MLRSSMVHVASCMGVARVGAPGAALCQVVLARCGPIVTAPEAHRLHDLTACCSLNALHQVWPLQVCDVCYVWRQRRDASASKAPRR